MELDLERLTPDTVQARLVASVRSPKCISGTSAWSIILISTLSLTIMDNLSDPPPVYVNFAILRPWAYGLSPNTTSPHVIGFILFGHVI